VQGGSRLKRTAPESFQRQPPTSGRSAPASKLQGSILHRPILSNMLVAFTALDIRKEIDTLETKTPLRALILFPRFVNFPRTHLNSNLCRGLLVTHWTSGLLGRLRNRQGL
jgi:hypothetical protein